MDFDVEFVIERGKVMGAKICIITIFVIMIMVLGNELYETACMLEELDSRPCDTVYDTIVRYEYKFLYGIDTISNHNYYDTLDVENSYLMGI